VGPYRIVKRVGVYIKLFLRKGRKWLFITSSSDIVMFLFKRENRFALVGKFGSSRWSMLHLHKTVLTILLVLGLPDLDSIVINQ
jgi:hypothetical protein